MNEVLEFDGIELRYGTRSILSSIHVKCMVGEIVGILGRNGCGKSSLFKVVFGSQVAEHCAVRLNERMLPPDFIRRRIIAYLPQTNLIPPHITIAKAMQLFEVENAELLQYFPELEEQLHLRPAALSGGFRRVIELVLILKSRSRFCMLDEPFSGVMPVHVETIRKMLVEAKANKGIILTDHLYRNVMATADKLYLLSNGTTYQVRDVHDLISRGYLTPGQSGS